MERDKLSTSKLTASTAFVKSLLGIAIGGFLIASGPAMAQRVSPSRWSAPISVPIVPVAAANLTDGTVLLWSADSPLDFSGGEVNPGKHENTGGTYTSIFDPIAKTSTQTWTTKTGHDMFCPGIANLPNGSIFVTGGSTSADVSMFNSGSRQWTAAKQMKIPRAYHGSVTLSNGGVFVLGGSWNGGEGGKSGETWVGSAGWQENTDVLADPAVNDVTNDAAGIYRSDNHMWLFADSNGRVFHAGPSQAMHWIDTTGSGKLTPAGNRGDDGDAMNGNAVMYDIRKILAVGGAPNYEENYATSHATLIDISNGQVNAFKKQSPMTYQRAFSNSVVLPSGQVVVIGGQTYPRPFSDDNAILTPELWTPPPPGVDSGTFTRLAPQAVPRTYHSFALLLPDGRVLSGGGGLCGDCSTNHTNVEILTPPYLLNPDGSPAARPKILSAPTNARLGSSISVTTDRTVSGFTLMRLSSVTHSLNNEQRRIPLNPISGSAGQYVLKIPGDPGVAVPGYYMLFALDANGTPSVSTTIRVH